MPERFRGGKLMKGETMADDVILEHCPECGKTGGIGKHWEDERFQYAPTGHPLCAMLECHIPVYTCKHCDFQYLNYEAEGIKDKVVQEYLKKMGQPPA